MRDRGIRILDYAETRQVRWLLASINECRDESTERRIIRSWFLLPHAAWSCPPAFVEPVVICRSRRRVLFRQQAGVLLESTPSARSPAPTRAHIEHG